MGRVVLEAIDLSLFLAYCAMKSGKMAMEESASQMSGYCCSLLLFCLSLLDSMFREIIIRLLLAINNYNQSDE